ncbi:mucin-3A-like [Palaemon carinicauda]|uniref:mucin-3A-like n=1 Tax=Palaemon carinicauda TaxID=392227 RepID=UPI0035B5A1DD
MWYLEKLLLTAAISSATGQRGYILPKPSCPVFTSNVIDIRAETSILVQTVNEVSTQFSTTTIVRQRVIPTIVFQTSVQTQSQIETSIIQRTSNIIIDQVITQTIPSPPIQQTIFVTITRFFPQISFIMQTKFQTSVIPIEVTNTRVQAVSQILTDFQTEAQRVTRVVSIPGRTIVNTVIQTVLQTSIFTSQAPGITRLITLTQTQEQFRTSFVLGQNTILTSIVQSQRIFPITITDTKSRNIVRTQEQVIFRDSTVTEATLSFQTVTNDVLQTVVIPVTDFTTLLQTVFQTFSLLQTITNTQYNAPSVRTVTQEVTLTSVVQVPGRNRVIFQEVVKTIEQKQTEFQTITGTQYTSVATTVTGSCSIMTGYGAPPPSSYTG